MLYGVALPILYVWYLREYKPYVEVEQFVELSN